MSLAMLVSASRAGLIFSAYFMLLIGWEAAWVEPACAGDRLSSTAIWFGFFAVLYGVLEIVAKVRSARGRGAVEQVSGDDETSVSA